MRQPQVVVVAIGLRGKLGRSSKEIDRADVVSHLIGHQPYPVQPFGMIRMNPEEMVVKQQRLDPIALLVKMSGGGN